MIRPQGLNEASLLKRVQNVRDQKSVKARLVSSPRQKAAAVVIASKPKLIAKAKLLQKKAKTPIRKNQKIATKQPSTVAGKLARKERMMKVSPMKSEKAATIPSLSTKISTLSTMSQTLKSDSGKNSKSKKIQF